MKTNVFLLSGFVLFLLLFFGKESKAQTLTMPDASPEAKVVQVVGISKVKVHYHRPYVNDRIIWDALVPYNEGNPIPWRAGANENTVIYFSDPVKVEGKELAAGSYGLHMITAENEWTIIFSKNYTSWGSFSYNPEEDALRVKVKPQNAGHHEMLTYSIDNVTKNEARVNMNWEKKQVSFNISFATDELVMQSVGKELRSVPGFTWQGWEQAARYSLDNNIDLDQGLKWVDRSISGGFGSQKTFVNMMTKSRFLDKMGKADEAKKTRSDAMAIATNNELNNYGYSLLNQGNTAEAVSIFKVNTEKNPTDPNVWDSLGEGYMKHGDKKKAVSSFQKSLSMKPAPMVKANSIRCLKELGEDVSKYEEASAK